MRLHFPSSKDPGRRSLLHACGTHASCRRSNLRVTSQKHPIAQLESSALYKSKLSHLALGINIAQSRGNPRSELTMSSCTPSMELDKTGILGEEQAAVSLMCMHRVHDVLTQDGSEDMPSSAGPSLLCRHNSQPLQDDLLPPPNALRRHSSEPICENGHLRRRFSHLQPSAFTHKIKLRSSYDINSRKRDVEHDELPTLSETERLLRDSFQRDTRVAVLSEQALESTEPTLTSSTGKLTRIQCRQAGHAD